VLAVAISISDRAPSSCSSFLSFAGRSSESILVIVVCVFKFRARKAADSLERFILASARQAAPRSAATRPRSVTSRLRIDDTHQRPIAPRRRPPTMPQDMPPTGGYNPVQYKRNLPIRGFRPAAYLVGTAALMTYGFWRVGQGIREHKYVGLYTYDRSGSLWRSREA
jgi:hypothetical protein